MAPIIIIISLAFTQTHYCRLPGPWRFHPPLLSTSTGCPQYACEHDIPHREHRKEKQGLLLKKWCDHSSWAWPPRKLYDSLLNPTGVNNAVISPSNPLPAFYPLNTFTADTATSRHCHLIFPCYLSLGYFQCTTALDVPKWYRVLCQSGKRMLCHQLLCYTRDIGTKMVLSSGPLFYRVLVCGK